MKQILFDFFHDVFLKWLGELSLNMVSICMCHMFRMLTDGTKFKYISII